MSTSYRYIGTDFYTNSGSVVAYAIKCIIDSVCESFILDTLKEIVIIEDYSNFDYNTLGNSLGRDYSPTKNDNYIGVAMGLCYILESKPIMKICFSLNYVMCINDDKCDNSLRVLHTILHELGHVDRNSKIIKKSKLKWENMIFNNPEKRFFYDIASCSINEYHADRMSAYVCPDLLDIRIINFEKSLIDYKLGIKDSIDDYIKYEDGDKLMEWISINTKMIFYFLGQMLGSYESFVTENRTNISLFASNFFDNIISGDTSDFWINIKKCLDHMFKNTIIENMDYYDEIIDICKKYISKEGLDFIIEEDGYYIIINKNVSFI